MRTLLDLDSDVLKERHGDLLPSLVVVRDRYFRPLALAVHRDQGCAECNGLTEDFSVCNSGELLAQLFPDRVPGAGEPERHDF